MVTAEAAGRSLITYYAGIYYKFEINASSWIVLYNTGETIYYGVIKSQYQGYFIDKVGNPKDEK